MCLIINVFWLTVCFNLGIYINLIYLYMVFLFYFINIMLLSNIHFKKYHLLF